MKILKKLPNICGILVFESNSVATKKGKRDGTIEVAHKVNPAFAAIKLYEEKNNKHIVKIKIIKTTLTTLNY